MAASFAQIMTAFHRQLQTVQPADWILPPRPSLRIHLGPSEIAAVRQVLAAFEADTIIIYLFFGSSADEAAWNGALTEAEHLRLLPVAVGAETFAIDRISMAATLLRYGGISLSVTPALQAGNEALIQSIDATVAEAGQNKGVSRASWMSTAAGVAGNIAVWRNREVLRLVDGVKNFPAIICGAGPSLSQSIPYLRQYRDRIFIFAVGRAFKTLDGHGIRPDMVVEIDANCSCNWDPALDPGDIPLAAAINADPGLTRRFRRILWCTASALDEPWNRWFAGLGTVPTPVATGRSVVIAAVDLAVRAGFLRIALTGSDLCYSESGHSHAGAAENNDQKHRLMPISGNDGGTVYSDKNFIGIRNALEKYLEHLDRKTVTVCNCTVGGAMIRGAEHRPLTEFAVGGGSGGSVVIGDRHPDGTAWIERTRDGLSDLVKLTELLVRTASDGSGKDVLPDSPVWAPITQLLSAESGLAENAVMRAWVKNIQAQTDDWLDGQAVSLLREEHDAAAVLGNLRCRYETMRLLAQGVLEKLTMAADVQDPESLPALTDDIYDFSGFRILASGLFAAAHPQLAEWLRHNMGSHDGWRLDVAWQNPPTVRRRMDDGGWVMLEPTLVEGLAMREEMQTALRNIAFRSDCDGIIFLAPCGWRYVMALNALEPGLRLLVIEPWPELLRQVAGCSLFFHLLPVGSGVIGADARFPEWPDLLRQRLAEWRRAGIESKLLIHPRAGVFPEVADLSRQLRTLISSL